MVIVDVCLTPEVLHRRVLPKPNPNERKPALAAT